MAEFREVLRQWRRMCTANRCRNCPGRPTDTKEGVCVLVQPDVGSDGLRPRTEAECEKIIMSWAAENPEPVYPTWKNYFASLYGQNYGLYGDKQLSVSRLCDEQIPPEVAQKLGLEPKYG